MTKLDFRQEKVKEKGKRWKLNNEVCVTKEQKS